MARHNATTGAAPMRKQPAKKGHLEPAAMPIATRTTPSPAMAAGECHRGRDSEPAGSLNVVPYAALSSSGPSLDVEPADQSASRLAGPRALPGMPTPR